MKKKIIISMLAAVATAGAYGQSQSQFSTSTHENAVVFPARPARPLAPAPVPIAPREGVVQVALRTGNPIQLLNPAAPPQYGNAQDHVSYDPNNPGKPKGIALFAWTF